MSIDSRLSALERLPAELRIRIYALVVVESDGLTLDCASKQPALAATNSSIRSEVLSIYYGQNTFMLDITSCNGTFAKSRFHKVVSQRVNHTESMTRVGAYGWNPQGSLTYTKLHVRIKEDQTIAITFYDVKKTTPACLCSIKKAVTKTHGPKDNMPFSARLLIARAIDLEETKDFESNREWERIMRSRFKMSNPNGPDEAGCEICNDFRESINFN